MSVIDRLVDWFGNLVHSPQELQRRREAGVRVGQKVRDGPSGNLLQVVDIDEQRAADRFIGDTPLPDYGENTKLDCEADLVVECQSSNSDERLAYPASRLLPLELAQVDYARDRFTGDVSQVEEIQGKTVGQVMIGGEPLSEYGVNRKLACDSDWTVACEYHYSRKQYAVPVSDFSLVFCLKSLYRLLQSSVSLLSMMEVPPIRVESWDNN